MILLAGRISPTKGWEDLSELGKTKVPMAKELSLVIFPLVLSGQAVGGRGRFGAKWCCKRYPISVSQRLN